MTTTPDVEGDAVAKLIAALPSTYKVDNTFSGPEVREGGAVPLLAAFCKHYGERRQLHYSGQGRELLVQVLRRFARDGWTPQRRSEAVAVMRSTYDALHLSGRFVGAVSGVTYLDIRAVDAPNELEPGYFALNFSFWYRG